MTIFPAVRLKPIAILLLVAAAAALAGALLTRAPRGRAGLPRLGVIPAFAMPDQRGELVTDQTLRGGVAIVNFFFASCTTTCPVLTSRVAAVQERIARVEASLGRALPIRLVSITLDPERDTPVVLATYAERHGARPGRWSFLSGRSLDLDRIVVDGFNATYELPEAQSGVGTIMHGEWLILVDATGAIRGYYPASDEERVAALVRDATDLARRAAVVSPPPKVWRATGVIESFGPSLAHAVIAHDEIPGYMAAMTMSFESTRRDQLHGLAKGDRVAFEFIETADARRVLVRVVRE